MTQDCPRCKLINPPEALRCDCGYDFVTRRVEGSYLQPKHMPLAAGVGIGGLFLFILVMRLLFTVLAQAR
jgi:hypothetical protein